MQPPPRVKHELDRPFRQRSSFIIHPTTRIPTLAASAPIMSQFRRRIVIRAQFAAAARGCLDPGRGSGRIANRSLPHLHGRVAGVDPAWFRILEKHGPQRDDRLFADRHAGTDFGERADPSPPADAHRFNHKPHAGIGPIMIAGAEIGPLGNARMRFEHDIAHIVDPGALPKPDMIANRQPPGIFDMNARLDQKPRPNPRAKRPENPRFEPI